MQPSFHAGLKGDPRIDAVYRPLEPGSFRLLCLHEEKATTQIECTLKTVLFEDKEQYDAITDAWNGEHPTAHSLQRADYTLRSGTAWGPASAEDSGLPRARMVLVYDCEPANLKSRSALTSRIQINMKEANEEKQGEGMEGNEAKEADGPVMTVEV